MAATEKVHIIGIGDDGLQGVSAAARQPVAEADQLIGTEHTLAAVPEGGGERMEGGADLDDEITGLLARPFRAESG